MSDSEINYLTQHLGLSPEYWKNWLTNVIELDPQVLELALKICPSWESFTRLREVKGFLKSLTDGKIPTVVNLPSKQGSDDEREQCKDKFCILDKALVLPSTSVRQSNRHRTP